MNLFFRLNLVLFLFFSVTGLVAQTNFRSGYIITNENDTLPGLIDYRGDSRNSKICVFKENKTSASREYLPGQIKAYRFLGSKYYVSRTILVKGVKKDLFLEFLVNGIADLYYYKNINYPHYLIEKSDGRLFELNNNEEIIEKDGMKYIRKRKEYIGSLKYAFADCPQLFETINNATLEAKSLVDITKKYHNYVCDDEKCIIYEKQLPPIKLTLAPFVSMNASSLNIEKGRYAYEAMKFQTSMYPSLGVLLNATMPRVNEKVSFEVSADVGKNYFYGTGLYDWNNSFNEARLNSTVLRCKGGLKYTYPTGKFRPTFMAGAHIAALVNKKGRRVEEKDENGRVITFNHAEDVLADKNYGLNLDLGVAYHKLDSFTPFVRISVLSSSGGKREINYKTYTELKTICISAGVYF